MSDFATLGGRSRRGVDGERLHDQAPRRATRRPSGVYPVEAALGDGGTFAGGRLAVDRVALRAAPLDSEAYGRLLTDALFAGPVAQAYDLAAGRAVDLTGGRLRVRLRIDAGAAKLHALAWEQLRHRFRGRDIPLATSSLTPSPATWACRTPRPRRSPSVPCVSWSRWPTPPGRPPRSPRSTWSRGRSLAEALGDVETRSSHVTVLPGQTGLPEQQRAALVRRGYVLADGPTSLDALRRLLLVITSSIWSRTAPTGAVTPRSISKTTMGDGSPRPTGSRLGGRRCRRPTPRGRSRRLRQRSARQGRRRSVRGRRAQAGRGRRARGRRGAGSDHDALRASARGRLLPTAAGARRGRSRHQRGPPVAGGRPYGLVRAGASSRLRDGQLFVPELPSGPTAHQYPAGEAANQTETYPHSAISTLSGGTVAWPMEIGSGPSPEELPIQPTPLLGRDAEVADLVALVGRAQTSAWLP